MFEGKLQQNNVLLVFLNTCSNFKFLLHVSLKFIITFKENVSK